MIACYFSRLLLVGVVLGSFSVARGESGVWAPDGVEFVHEKQFRGHEELAARVTGAYEAFVASGKYAVTSAGDVTRHDDIVIFTAQLRTPDGTVDWEARVFLLLGPGNLIREDYQLTVKPLPA